MIHVLRYLAVLLYTAFWSCVVISATVVDRSGESVLRMLRIWIAWIYASCGVSVEAAGLENISPRQSYVFMSNHASVWDSTAIVATIPVSWRFVYKKELAWIPFFGWALLAHRHVMVDRGNRVRAVRSLQAAAERVRTGMSVIIFPEGTRSESGTMGEFKSGGFHLAIQAGVPIIPMSVSGGRDVTPKGSLRIDGGKLRIVYGKPIPTEGLTAQDRNTLKDEVRRAILQGLD